MAYILKIETWLHTCGQERVQALLMVLVLFCLQPEGFRNRQLRPLLAQLLGLPESQISPGRMSYDLRRLRLHGLSERIPRTIATG